MNTQINGHVTMDTYMVFGKASITAENKSLVRKAIDLDTYIYRFDRDLWGTSDAHAQAERDLDKYADALGEYIKYRIEQMFESCAFDVYKTSYSSDVIVSPYGAATVRLTLDIDFNGVNPRLPKSELGAEIEKQINERHGDLTGIAEALICVDAFIDIH